MKRILITTVVVLVCLNSCMNIHGEMVMQNANEAEGFNFPYLLFIPENTNKNLPLTLVVEPNNTGHTSDNFDDHIEGAEQSIENFGYLGKFLSDNLNYPLLVPIFPRSDTDWKTYTHALDRDALNTNDESIKRIDLQLLAMIKDSQSKLAGMGYNVQDKIIMTGFSASATFANRFVFMHPDKVQVCAAGGLNGILMLPQEQLNNTPLKYPLGTYDFQNIFGDSINLRSLNQVKQFLFMGETDDNDAVAYDDAYDNDEREIVYANFGKELPARWGFCSNVYTNAFDNVTLKTYKETGHTITDEMRSDVLAFVKASTGLK